MNATKDLHLYESGGGGELLLENNDVQLSETLFQVVYISLFGGNIEASTLGNEVQGQERNDYWANSLLFADQPNKQFNSQTERVLNTVALNSAGRLEIQTAVENDLEFLLEIADVAITVSIMNTYTVEITINLTGLDNQRQTPIAIIYNNASGEIIVQRTI